MTEHRADKGDDFIELTFKPGTWDAKGIPERGCRMRRSMFQQLVVQGGPYSEVHLIAGLIDWLNVAEDPEDARAVLQALLDRHYPEFGPFLP